jgi:hypothetical protein
VVIVDARLRGDSAHVEVVEAQPDHAVRGESLAHESPGVICLDLTVCILGPGVAGLPRCAAPTCQLEAGGRQRGIGMFMGFVYG